MIFGIVTLITSLLMATVAAVFAIYGIVAIFAGMPIFALVMGAVVELGKIVGISWLYRNWNEPTKIKYAMLPFVMIAMLLTSMGVFGLLSKAHLEQTSPVANNEIQIIRLDQQIAREQSRIADSDQVISQLDQSVQALIEFDRIRGPDGALAVRENQASQRNMLRQTIEAAQSELDRLEDQKLELSHQLQAIQLEVGPVKYIAELVYGNDTDRTEEAVRWVIIAFIFVFDPMAILLLMAANYTLSSTKKQTIKTNIEASPTTPIEPSIVVEPSISPINFSNDIFDGEKKQSDLNPTDHTIEYDARADISNTEQLHVIDSDVFVKEKSIETANVVTLNDVGGGYVEYENHLYQKGALKELKPELFSVNSDEPTILSSGFGSQFPKIAKKRDMFVRIDVVPNKVFRFEGSKWIEIDKQSTNTYLYDQEYLRYLVEKISTGQYDVDLLTEQEKIQIDEHLNNQAS